MIAHKSRRRPVKPLAPGSGVSTHRMATDMPHHQGGRSAGNINEHSRCDYDNVSNQEPTSGSRFCLLQNAPADAGSVEEKDEEKAVTEVNRPLTRSTCSHEQLSTVAVPESMAVDLMAVEPAGKI